MKFQKPTAAAPWIRHPTRNATILKLGLTSVSASTPRRVNLAAAPLENDATPASSIARPWRIATPLKPTRIIKIGNAYRRSMGTKLFQLIAQIMEVEPIDQRYPQGTLPQRCKSHVLQRFGCLSSSITWKIARSGFSPRLPVSSWPASQPKDSCRPNHAKRERYR